MVRSHPPARLFCVFFFIKFRNNGIKLEEFISLMFSRNEWTPRRATYYSMDENPLGHYVLAVLPEVQGRRFNHYVQNEGASLTSFLFRC